MSLKKRVLTSPALLLPLAVLVYVLLKIMYATNRKTYDHHAETLPYARGEKAGIYCFWHGRMLAQLFVNPPGRIMYVFSTRHTDGLAASMLYGRFGIRTVWGTRSKGTRAAARAARALLEVVMEGHNVAITPDGPRGPTQVAAPGAAYLASKSGLPLIPVGYSSTRHKRFNSWDHFMLFLPFGRIHHAAGAPIFVPADADDETLARSTQQLQDALNRLVLEADKHCGVVP